MADGRKPSKKPTRSSGQPAPPRQKPVPDAAAPDRPGPGPVIADRPGSALPGGLQKGEVLAGARRQLLAAVGLDKLLDPKTLKKVVRLLEPLIETQPVAAGESLPVRRVTTTNLSTLVSAAALQVARVRPAVDDSADAAVVWTHGDEELLVHVGQVSTATGDGFVDVTIPVECDETGRADVVVTLVTAHPDRPFGAVLATTHRPHGPLAVVDRWSEALISFAWSTVATTVGLVAGTAGRDEEGNQLAATTVVATTEGLDVVPTAAYRFNATSVRQRVLGPGPVTPPPKDPR